MNMLTIIYTAITAILLFLGAISVFNYLRGEIWVDKHELERLYKIKDDFDKEKYKQPMRTVYCKCKHSISLEADK